MQGTGQAFCRTGHTIRACSEGLPWRCSLRSACACPLMAQPKNTFQGGAFQSGVVLVPDGSWWAPVLGGIGYRQVNRIRLGSDGLVWFGSSNQLRGAAGLFEVGYAVVNQFRWWVIPYWGLGGGYFRFPDKDKGTRFLLSLGLGIHLQPQQPSSRAIIIGLRLGLLSAVSRPHASTFLLTLTFGRNHHAVREIAADVTGGIR